MTLPIVTGASPRDQRAETFRATAEQAWRDGHLDEAVGAFRLAILHQPDDGHLWRRLANVLKAAGRSDEALQAYRVAVALEPVCADLLRQIGNLLRERGRIPEALAAYRHAIAVRLDVAALFQLRLGLLARGDGEAANIRLCRMILAIEPDHRETWCALAEALCRSEDLAGALTIYHRLDATTPGRAAVRHNIAVLDLILSLLPEREPARSTGPEAQEMHVDREKDDSRHGPRNQGALGNG